MEQGKYWERASLGQLAKDLDEIDTVPIGIIGTLKRLLREMEQSQAVPVRGYDLTDEEAAEVIGLIK